MSTVCACRGDQVCALCVGLTDPEVIAAADDCLRELGLAWLINNQSNVSGGARIRRNPQP
jgi:hypothetical protein